MMKREWVYIQKPIVYEMSCDLCGGINIEWSEYEGMIWCYDCQKDTKGNGGLFDGPISLELCDMFGISFKRFYMNENEIRTPTIEDGKIKYVPFCCPLPKR